MKIGVERTKPCRPKSTPLIPSQPLTPADLEARARALQREWERQAVVKALKARGDDIYPDVSYDELRMLFSDIEWDALAIEGSRHRS